jgi:hypothetical protein
MLCCIKLSYHRVHCSVNNEVIFIGKKLFLFFIKMSPCVGGQIMLGIQSIAEAYIFLVLSKNVLVCLGQYFFYGRNPASWISFIEERNSDLLDDFVLLLLKSTWWLTFIYTLSGFCIRHLAIQILTSSLIQIQSKSNFTLRSTSQQLMATHCWHFNPIWLQPT